jgi:hypothetical protein
LLSMYTLRLVCRHRSTRLTHRYLQEEEKNKGKYH